MRVTRGGVIGFVGGVLTGVKDFFVASWTYLKRSNATFSSLGDELITSAQTDLLNLKGKLDQLWVIQDEDKQTTALYLAAVLGKFGFTFIIIGVSLIASLLKLTGGSCCLFLAGRWLTLVSKLFNIFSKTFMHALTMLQSGLRKFVTNALDLCSKIAQNLGYYVGRFLNAILDVLRTLTPYLSRALQITLDFVAAARRAIWQGIKAIGRLARNVIRNFGSVIINCLKGIGHLVLGTLRAGSIVAKGIVLSVAALFIETGIANSLSGVAKTMFILDESLAEGIGALMDGVYASGSSFIKAAKSMFGYGVTIPDAIPVRESDSIVAPIATVADELEIESEASDHAVAPILNDSRYFSRKVRDNMHYVNECVASAGNELLSSYQEQRNRMIGASGWSHAEDREAVGLFSSHRRI